MFDTTELEQRVSVATDAPGCSFEGGSRKATIFAGEGRTAELYLGECLSVMKGLPDSSVDLVAADLPYGVTQNSWDSIIPLEALWAEFRRVAKTNAAIVLTATQPFTSLLVLSNPKEFKYDLVWEKTVSSGQLNVGHQPMRSHESVLVFYRKKPTYNEQRLPGLPYQISRKATYEGPGYGAQKKQSKSERWLSPCEERNKGAKSSS